MHIFALFSALPLLAASVPVLELSDLAALYSKRDPRLRPNTMLQVTGELSDFIDRDGSTVLALFDKATGTAVGCEIPRKSRRHFPGLLAKHRYTVEGTVSKWQPSESGGALLLLSCKVLEEPIELRKDTLYLGVMRTGEHETGFHLKLLDGGEGPVQATFLAIDSAGFLREWERSNRLSVAQLLSLKPTEWTGYFSRATKTFHFSRLDQKLDLVLTSPASFSGKLTVQKELQTDARMIVANSSGYLIDYQVSPDSAGRRPVPSKPSHSGNDPNRQYTQFEVERIANEWLESFRKSEEAIGLGIPSLNSATRIGGAEQLWEVSYFIQRGPPRNMPPVALKLVLHIVKAGDQPKVSEHWLLTPGGKPPSPARRNSRAQRGSLPAVPESLELTPANIQPPAAPRESSPPQP